MVEIPAGGPGGPEGKDILLLLTQHANRPALGRDGEQARAPRAYGVEGERGAVRAPRGRVQLTSVPFRHPARLRAPAEDPDPGRIPVRREGDAGAIGRKRGSVLAPRPVGPLLRPAPVQGQNPYVVAPAPVGRERDPASIGRPMGLPMIEGAARVLSQPGPVRRHAPDVVVAVPVGLEGDAAPVRRPRGLARIPHGIGERRGNSPVRGHHPDAAQKVQRERALVRRKRQRHIRALRDRDLDSSLRLARGRNLGSHGGSNDRGCSHTDSDRGSRAKRASSRSHGGDRSRQRVRRNADGSGHCIISGLIDVSCL